MLGQKINEFDNSQGLVRDFDRIFFKNKLSGFRENEEVEILGIDIESGSCLNRHVRIGNRELTVSFDNYFNDENEDYQQEKTRFKYFVKDLDGTVLARGYSFDELAQTLNISVAVLKKRFQEPIDGTSYTKHRFNVTRREI